MMIIAILLFLMTREFVFGFDFNVMIMNSMGFDATAPLVKRYFFFRIWFFFLLI